MVLVLSIHIILGIVERWWRRNATDTASLEVVAVALDSESRVTPLPVFFVLFVLISHRHAVHRCKRPLIQTRKGFMWLEMGIEVRLGIDLILEILESRKGLNDQENE